jgi:hypothetical protein
MKNWKRVALSATILTLSAVTVFASAALAQGPGPANQNGAGSAQANRFGNGGGGTGPGYGLAVKGAWAGPDQSLVAVAAEAFDMEQTDLVAELQAGKTLAEVAEANDVAVQDLVDAFLAPRAEFLAQAVTDGKITQADADAMQARMQAMVTTKISQPWEPRGNGTCDGTCDGPQGEQMRGSQGQRQGHGMAGRSLPQSRMGRGMGRRWQ